MPTAELTVLLGEAESFHSHLGPFLVLGLRAGLIGLQKLKLRKGNLELRAQVELPYRVPISCLLDGIQFSTACTVGNKRLSFKDSTHITLIFIGSGKAVELTLRKTTLMLLRRLLCGEQLGERDLSGLARSVATIDEKQLFDVEERAAEPMRAHA